MPTVQFLHQLEKRARQAHSSLERHQAAFYLWEFGLRMLGCVSVIEYADSGIRDPKLESVLQNLSRPALGHWWELVRLLVPVLAENGDEEFRKIESRLLRKSSDSLWDVIKLDVALRKVLNPNEDVGSRQTVRLRELFDRLVRYRNNEWHGFLGGREPEFYEDMSTALIAGVWELWQHIDVIAGRKLIFVEDVRRIPDGSYRVMRWDLSDEKAEALPPLDLSTSETAALPLPGRLYLGIQTAETQNRDSVPEGHLLYPLALYELPQQELFLYGSADRRKGNVAYIGSMSGEHPQDVDVKDRRELLQRLLSREVTDEQVNQWTEVSRIDDAPDADPRLSLHERHSIGEFQLISRLGSGGFGTVYRAWQPAMRREVAVKRLSNPGKPEQRQRFSREVQALGRVDHPHLVKVFHSGTDGEDLFFAMELVEGADLERVLQELTGKEAAKVDSDIWHSAVSQACESARSEETPLSNSDEADAPLKTTSPIKARTRGTASRFGKGHVRHTVELIRDVADAVQCLHDANVLHRDIKPGNIMITPEGEAIVMDLGLAQLGDADTLTKSRQFVGTIRYSSPEQAFSSRGLEARSDIYSLGATFWELLTLRPFLGITKEVSTDQQFARIRRDDPELVTKYNAHVPSDLARIVAKCVEKDETRRYRSMADLVDDLNRWLRGEPVLAQDPSIGYLLRKAVRKHRKLVASLTVAVVILVIVTIGGILFLDFARRDAERLAGELQKTVVEKDKLTAHLEVRTTDLQRRTDLLTNQTARLYIEQGTYEYDQGRIDNGCIQLVRAWSILPETDPLRKSAELLAIDRLTRKGRSVAMFRHQVIATCISISPDGTRVVTGSGDGTARVWDASTGKPIGEPLTHNSWVRSVAFSPDGTRVVTGSWDNTARVWESSTGKPIGEPLTHKDAVHSVAFSPDGTRVVTGSSDGTARVWEASTGKPIGEPLTHKGSVRSVAFSLDGARVLTVSDYNTARVWEASTCKPIGETLVHEDDVTSVAFSPDGTRVVTVSEDNTARVWEVSTGKPIGEPLMHEDNVTSVAFSPDGTRVLTVSEDGTARVWEASTGKPLGEPLTHNSWVHSAAFSPDGTRVVTVSGDKTARVWEASTRKPIGEPLTHKGSVRSVAFSPDGTRVVTGSGDGTARVWEASTGKLIGETLTHEGPVWSVAFSPDGTRVVTGSYGHTARVWEASTGKPIGEPLTHKGSVRSVAFSPDGTRVVTGSGDGTARVWEASTRKPIGEPLTHEGSVRSVAFSLDGARVLTVSEYNTARVWEASTGKPIGEPLTHKGSVRSVAFSPDGTRVVTGSEDGTARVWEVSTGKPIGEPLMHEDTVTSVAFGPDGTRVLTVSEDNTARVWEASTGKPIGETLMHEGPVWSVAFNPDGTRVVTGSEDGTARVWDLAVVVPQGVNFLPWLEYQTGVSVDINGEVTQFTLEQVKQCELQLSIDRGWIEQSRIAYVNRTTSLLLDAAHRAEQASDWFAAAFNLQQLCQIHPSNQDYHARWARALAERGDWNSAGDAFAGMKRLKPDSWDIYYEGGLAILASTDSKSFRDWLGDMMTLAEQSSDPNHWDQTAWLAVLTTLDSQQASNAAELAHRAVKSDPTSWDYRETLGAALYRRHQIDEAVAELLQAVDLHNKSNSSETNESEPSKQTPTDPEPKPTVQDNISPSKQSDPVGSFFTHAFLVMAYHELGKPEDTAKHRKILDTIEQTPDASELDWMQRLRRQLLRKEIESLMGPAPPKPGEATPSPAEDSSPDSNNSRTE